MSQRTAIVTGAGIGLGRATALALAEANYHVIVTDILDDEGAQVVAETLVLAGRYRGARGVARRGDGRPAALPRRVHARVVRAALPGARRVPAAALDRGRRRGGGARARAG